jgi:hypothetical protein
MIRVRILRVPIKGGEEVLARVWLVLERHKSPSPVVEIEMASRRLINIGLIFWQHAPVKLILDAVRPWLEAAHIAILPDGPVERPTDMGALVRARQADFERRGSRGPHRDQFAHEKATF